MANDFVNVTSATSGATIEVAAETIAGVAYQKVKLAAGGSGSTVAIDATSGVPAASSVGVVVAMIPGASVSAQVSGTVTVGTGTVSVSGAVQVSGTLSVSGTQVVSGTVSVSNVLSATGVLVSVLSTGTVSVSQAAFTTASSGLTATATGMIVVATGTVTAVVTGTISVSNVLSATGVLVSVLSTGTVSISGVVLASITVSATVGTVIAVSGITAVSNLSTVVTVLGTVNVNLAAAGTTIPVNIVAGGAAPGTTVTTQTSLTAQLMWLAQSQTILVTIAAGAGGGGSVTTAAPSISATGQIVYIVGGQSTSALPVYVSQINPPAGGGGSVTTAVPSISATGQIMFVVGGQSTTANPVFVSNVVLTNIVTLATGGTIATLLGSVLVSGALSVVSTVLGTVNVNQVGLSNYVTNPASAASGMGVYIVGLSTTALSGVTGPNVWLGASQSVLVGGTAVVTLATGGTIATLLGSVLVSGALSVVSTILGTVVVTLATGGTVATLLGTVLIANANLTTAAPSISATGQPVWIAGGQSTSALPVYVSQINPPAGGGGSVTTAAPSISATGQIMYVVGGQSTTALPVYVSQLAGSLATVATIVAVSGVTAVSAVSTIVTILGTAVVSVVPGLSVLASITVSAALGTVITVLGTINVAPRPPAATNVLILVSSTVVGSNTTLLFTVFTGGTLVTTGTSAWAPARFFQIMNIQMAAQSSATIIGGLLAVIGGTAAASVSVTSTVAVFAALAYVPAAPGQFNAQGLNQFVSANTTLGIAIINGTSFTMAGAVIQGNLVQ